MNDKTEENMFVERSSVWGHLVCAEKFYCSEKDDQVQWYESTWVFAQGWGLSRVMSLCIGLKYRPCRAEDLVQFWSCVWSVWQSDRLYPSKSDYNCYYSCICHFIQNQWRWFMSMSTGSAWTSLTKRRASCQSANSFARWTATVSQPFPSLLVCQQDAVEVISSKDFSLCKQHVFLLQMQSEAALLVLLQYIASREIIKFSESCYGVFAQKCP